MRFIPKKKLLTEAEVNPLNTNNPDLSQDEAYCQAILSAIASETAAYNEYDQILSLEDKVSKRSLVDHFHDTLVDVRDEEMKHIAQLTTKISEVPELKAAYDAGREEANAGKEQPVEKDTEAKEEDVKESKKVNKKALTEAVQPGRMYEKGNVIDAIANAWNLSDEDYWNIEDTLNTYEEELTAEEVDSALARISASFEVSPEMLEAAENAIVNSSDPVASRQDDFKNDVDFDISSIEDLIDNLYTVAAKSKLQDVITYLRQLNYDGNKDTGWTSDHVNFSGSNPKKNIVA